MCSSIVFLFLSFLLDIYVLIVPFSRFELVIILSLYLHYSLCKGVYKRKIQSRICHQLKIENIKIFFDMDESKMEIDDNKYVVCCLFDTFHDCGPTSQNQRKF